MNLGDLFVGYLDAHDIDVLDLKAGIFLDTVG